MSRMLFEQNLAQRKYTLCSIEARDLVMIGSERGEMSFLEKDFWNILW